MNTKNPHRYAAFHGILNLPAGTHITLTTTDGTTHAGEVNGRSELAVTLYEDDGVARHYRFADCTGWHLTPADPNRIPATAAQRMAATEAMMMESMLADRAAKTAQPEVVSDFLDIDNDGAAPAPVKNIDRTNAVKKHLKAVGVTSYTVASRHGYTTVVLATGAGSSMDDVVAALAALPWASFSIRVNHYLRMIDIRHNEAPAPADPATPVVIIACGGKKADRPVPAGELYTGSYHRSLRKAADALAASTGARILILSALHGLLTLDEVKDPYSKRMGRPGSITAGEVAGQAEQLGIRAAARVTVLGGRDYADMVSAVWPHAVRPFDGTHGIGEQKARCARIVRDAVPPLPGQAELIPAAAAVQAPAPVGDVFTGVLFTVSDMDRLCA